MNTYYTNMWLKVDDLNEKSLPQSALDEVDKIYRQAVKEKNSPQIIKAFMYKSDIGTLINSDNALNIIEETEEYLKTSSDDTERSMLCSVLAGMYQNYYRSQQYLISRRTEISGYVPSDIREWTKSLFIRKIIEDVRLSIQPEKILQNTDALRYSSILEKGDDSRIFRPTLYDFLANRGIDILKDLFDYPQPGDNADYLQPAGDFIKLSIQPKNDDVRENITAIYQKILIFRLNDKNKEAFLMADLDRSDFIYPNSTADGKDSLYLSNLQQLKQEWAGKDISVEILNKEAEFYLNETPAQISEGSEKKQTDELAQKQKAYAICREGIDKYPNYRRIGILKNLLARLTASTLQASGNNSVYPDSDLELSVHYNNINTLNVQLYRIASDRPGVKGWGESSAYKTKGTLIKEMSFDLKTVFPYENKDTVFNIPVPATGLYEYVLSTDNPDIKPVSTGFAVTQLASIARNRGNNNIDILVTDRLSGKPVENATVQLYDNIYVKNPVIKETITTGKDGIAVYSGTKGYTGYSVVSGDDRAGFISNMPWSQNYGNSDNNAQEQLTILTDRSIYRPGQTVFFKGIVWKSDENSAVVIPNKTVDVVFKDANYQNLATKSLTAGEFGSFTGEFVIPQQVRSGTFYITGLNTTTYITVSEYKRPTFQIDFQPIADTYSFGDEISVKGNARNFSGVPLQSVQVNYQVIRRPHFLYRWYPDHSSEKQIASGVATLDDEGRFTISFKAGKDKSDLKGETYYTYELTASITDTNGETQQNTTYVSVGDKSMHLTFSFDGSIDKIQPGYLISESIDKTQSGYLKITAENLNNAPIKTQGTYTLYSLIDETSLKKTKTQPFIDVYTGEGEPQYNINKEVLSGRFSTPDSISTASWKNLPSGRYRIVAKAPDSKGNEVTGEQNFVLYSKEDQKSPILTYRWLIKEKTTCNPGENAEIILGSSAENVYVLYEIFGKNQLLERKRFEISKENKKLLIPYKPEYGNNVTLSLTYIKDETVFAENILLTKKEENKKLDLSFAVFRDKLLPGQKEEWKLTIKDDKSNAVAAELLAGMYDASLNKIRPHAWYFAPRTMSMTYFYNFDEGTGFRTQNISMNFNEKYPEVSDFKFDVLKGAFALFPQNNLVLYEKVSGASTGRIRGGATLKDEGYYASSDNSQLTFAQAELPAASSETVQFITPAITGSGESGEQTPASPVQIRQNFNETAFFLPQLKTNEKGEVVISFTVPESTTSWKFMGLAHTKDLKVGQLTAETVTQKDLMVIPNLPRFMRQGDRTSVSAKIANLSDKNLQGKVTLELYDPETEKTVVSVDHAEQSFSVDAAGSSSVSWNFTVPEGSELLGCRVIAQTSQFSDGEQHLLPVLSGRILVTETLPMTLRSNQTRSFEMSKLIDNKSVTLSNYRLTLEFTGNSSWYAVQALPTLSNPTSDNAISWFASYYVNTLAGHISQSNPEIKKVVDIWQQQAGTKETLLSALEKNQELKSVLLQETPWVLDAKNETEQKQRLSLLFDLNRQSQSTSDALQKLSELQNQDGGWMWFKGMASSRYITTYILENMHRLSKLGAVQYGESEKMMQTKALNYLDQQIVDDYANLKKYGNPTNNEMHIDDMQMYYLCVRSRYRDIPLSKKALEAYKYYAGQAETHRNKLTLYGKAQGAMFFDREGKTSIVGELIRSLKEFASKSDELGMFWANNRSGYFWNQSAIAVQTTILEAFDEIGNGNPNFETSNDIEEMKLWLLKQKQTQSWDAVPSTVNAIYALLLRGQNLLSGSKEVNIQWGTRKIDTGNNETGTGYFKQSFDNPEITPDMGKVTVDKPGEGIAWGALYWQYFEDLDKVTGQTGALSVEKMLFVERTGEKGKTIEPVTDDNPLKVGDKAVVRLTVRTDRDLEYVSLKDLRAACFEPTEQLSGFRFSERVGYYQDIKDVSTNFYFNYLPKGTYIFEYSVWVNRAGEYSTGLSTIQCMYAPEFVSHSEGGRLKVKN